jgi:gamma-glutamylcyclotransferase (GGCT)/AIG2-like uncharacterized protein YtfP
MTELPLFVYGTLLSNGAQAALLPGRRRPGWVHGTLYGMPAGYPALVPGGSDPVYGEWLDPVPPRVLSMLDAYEGVDQGLYQRVEIDVHTTRVRFRAWAWAMEQPAKAGGVRIRSGRWRSLIRR